MANAFWKIEDLRDVWAHAGEELMVDFNKLKS